MVAMIRAKLLSIDRGFVFFINGRNEMDKGLYNTVIAEAYCIPGFALAGVLLWPLMGILAIPVMFVPPAALTIAVFFALVMAGCL